MGYERCYFGDLPYNRNRHTIKHITSLDEAYVMARRLALWLDFNVAANELSCIKWEVEPEKTDKEKTCIEARKSVGFMKNWEDKPILNFMKCLS